MRFGGVPPAVVFRASWHEADVVRYRPRAPSGHGATATDDRQERVPPGSTRRKTGLRRTESRHEICPALRPPLPLLSLSMATVTATFESGALAAFRIESRTAGGHHRRQHGSARRDHDGHRRARPAAWRLGGARGALRGLRARLRHHLPRRADRSFVPLPESGGTAILTPLIGAGGRSFIGS